MTLSPEGSKAPETQAAPRSLVSVTSEGGDEENFSKMQLVRLTDQTLAHQNL